MKRHPVELLSLISGLVFLGFAGSYLLGEVAGFTPSGRVTFPLLLVGLGVAGIAAAVVSQRREDTETRARISEEAHSTEQSESDQNREPEEQV